VQEVSVTGRVEPTESVHLAFEIAGRVSEIYTGVGDRVEQGDRLVRLDSGELDSQLSQANADLETTKAELADLQKGTRIEEITAAETTVANAERSLADSEANLLNVQNKAAADLENTYNIGLNTSQKAVIAAKKRHSYAYRHSDRSFLEYRTREFGFKRFEG